MINNSLPEYLFIRACVFALRAIGPLSILYSFLRPFMPISNRLRLRLLPLDVYAAIETAFLLFVYLPLRARSQRPTVHPPLTLPSERKALFERCVTTTSEYTRYLRQWFRNAELAEIKMENVQEFFAWAFLNKASPRDTKQVGEAHSIDANYEQELEKYTEGLEMRMGSTLPQGYGKAKSLRLTLDEVRMAHRPLIWYMIIFLVDILTHFWLLFHKFSFYRTPLQPARISVFPPRPQTIFTRHVSASSNLSYWHRPHSSSKHRPILFLHGIGVGLNTYVSFLQDLNASSESDERDGDVGILALELLPISFRITHPLPRREEFCLQLKVILESHQEFAHGFTLVAHSYGSVLATHILSSPSSISLKILVKSLVLVDPVSVLLHLPDVAYNFTYRSPRSASQWQLWYFASTDIGVAHTLARGFFWSENILWKKDCGNIPVTTFLAGRDIIAPTSEICTYLTNGEESSDEGWTRGAWDEGHVVWRTHDTTRNLKTVVWCDGLDHAQIFDRLRWRQMLVSEVKRASVV